MNNIKDKYQSTFNNIDSSLEIKNNIKNNIKVQYKKKLKVKKIIFSISTVFIVMLTSLGIVYADDIKDKLYSLFFKSQNDLFIIESNNRKKINDDAKIIEPICNIKILEYSTNDDYSKCYSLYTNDELKNILGIKLLSFKNSKKDKYILNMVRRNNDNKIKMLSFKMVNIFDENIFNKNNNIVILSMKAKIFTKYYDDFIYSNYSIEKDAIIDEYYIENLNIKAYICEYNNLARYPENLRRQVYFIYDDIMYEIDVETTNDIDINTKVYELLNSLIY